MTSKISGLHLFLESLMNEQEAWQQRLVLAHRELPELFAGGKGKAVLYVGASPRRFQLGRELFEAGYEITLLEAHKLNVESYSGHPWLKNTIHGDVRSLGETICGQKWDAIIWWHGPEHVTKEEGKIVLSQLERLTKRLMVLGCPWGQNRAGPAYGNPYEEHLSHWYVKDMEKLGYETRTLGEKDNPSTWCHIMAWKFL